MKILFITSSRIGDAVLSTGLLDRIARDFPLGRLTIVCGPLAASLFEGYPLLAEIIPLKKERYNGHWLKLWRHVAGTRWDRVVDLRNSAVSRLIRAEKRFIFGPRLSKGLHKVEQCAALMGMTDQDDVPAPRLWFTQAQMSRARRLIPEGPPVLGVGPAANWAAKTWPAARFIEVVNWMTAGGGLMAGARIAVFAAPGEEAVAEKVLHAVPPERRIDVIAKGDPGTAAAALSLCDFYLGNDSGLMHCAAAAGVPTLGLFGPSYPAIYRPWGSHAAYISTPESFDELIDYPGYTPQSAPCLMESLSVESVKEKLSTMFDMRQNGVAAAQSFISP